MIIRKHQMGTLTWKVYDPEDPDLNNQSWTIMIGGLKGTTKQPTESTPQTNLPSSEPNATEPTNQPAGEIPPGLPKSTNSAP